MTRYTDHTTLTAGRLESLRLIVTGATRRRDGSPFVLQRRQLQWFVENGYILPPPPRPPTDGRLTPDPNQVLVPTAKALAACDAAPCSSSPVKPSEL